MQYRNRSWKPVPYTREEIEANKELASIEASRAEEIEASAEIIRWTAGNGAEIIVRLAHGGHGYDVSVGGKWHEDCEMVAAPEKYRAAGLVAKLGPIGLTAERKAVLESK